MVEDFNNNRRMFLLFVLLVNIAILFSVIWILKTDLSDLKDTVSANTTAIEDLESQIEF